MLKKHSNSRNVCIRIKQTGNDFDLADSDQDLAVKVNSSPGFLHIVEQLADLGQVPQEGCRLALSHHVHVAQDQLLNNQNHITKNELNKEGMSWLGHSTLLK